MRGGGDVPFGELDLNAPSFFADPYPVYAQLRAASSPVFDPTSGTWMVSRYADVEAVLREARISNVTARALPPPFNLSLLSSDPPEHGRIRTILNKAFASIPPDIEQRVREIADELLDGMLEAGSADFMRDFALPLPIAVISVVLGVPSEDMDHLRALSYGFINHEGGTAEQLRAGKAAAILGWDRYFRGFIAEHPRAGLIGALLRPDRASASRSHALSEEELVGNLMLLLVAGHETTVNLLGNALYLLLERRARLERVRAEPELLPMAIEETLRYESPVQLGAFRVAREAIEVGGRTIPAGEMVTAMFGSANRDPDYFSDADSFVLGRSDNRHLGFGSGPHRCLGAPLARMEARIGLERVLERLPEIRLSIGRAEPFVPQWGKARAFRGLRQLEVRF